MNRSLAGIGLSAAALLGAPAEAADSQTKAAATAAQQVTRAGAEPSAVGPADYFTGPVRVDPVWPADKDINASGHLVTFEPGARSAWHTHPAGQRLVVVSGMGLTQEWSHSLKAPGSRGEVFLFERGGSSGWRVSSRGVPGAVSGSSSVVVSGRGRRAPATHQDRGLGESCFSPGP